MIRTWVAVALLIGAQSLTCKVAGKDKDKLGPNCDTSKHLEVCFFSLLDQSSGCLPREAAALVDETADGCAAFGCWCITADCNTETWAIEFNRSYVPPPKCWTGVMGAKRRPVCEKTKLYNATEFVIPDCQSRSFSSQCVENNKVVGTGDGCGFQQTSEACASYSETRSKRSIADSFDGTDKHCRWIPQKTSDEKISSCEFDGGCKFYSDRGRMVNGANTGECSVSDSSTTKWNSWLAKRGAECDNRNKSGCFENNDDIGQAQSCTQHSARDACLAQVHNCLEGDCSGNATSGTACSTRKSEAACSSDGCSWKKQCCKWIPAPIDPEDTCANKDKGTMDGMCQYNDGNGPPSIDVVREGFNFEMFKKKHDNYEGKCTIIASSRIGKGAAAALGADKGGVVQSRCNNTEAWDSYSLTKDIGLTTAAIDEYCQNFIPDASAMSAIESNTPSSLINASKNGQLGAVISGFGDLTYVVTAKPEFGECLLVADPGKFGAAVCTCEGEECNNVTALSFVVGADAGPMRLLRFIDGSFSQLKDIINGNVSGILDENGAIDPANVSKVTEADVDAIMKLPGVSDLTSKAELWGFIQDFQTLVKAQTDYKAQFMTDLDIAALKANASQVAAANAVVSCELYSADGTPNPLCLETLSADETKAVASATGFSVQEIERGIQAAKTLGGSIELPGTAGTIQATAPNVVGMMALGMLAFASSL
eukprot:TRINITY_DN92267_c0_g1_i1.p1 TRINITY_DN92267_c0_g1~~TRINITY_DN92267_c0_g1_i1.p1  ORF type:complete len:719 (+),score=136.34 TRINITY_DN92267_c0_g1_i1:29-2158(+)